MGRPEIRKLPTTSAEIFETDHPFIRFDRQIIAVKKWPNQKCKDCLGSGYLGVVTRKPIAVKLGRNSPCKCGSGKKFKNCCLKRVEAYKRSISSIQLCYCVGFGKVVDVPEPNIEQIKEELEKEYS